MTRAAEARVGSWWARGLEEVRADVEALQEPGRWVVAMGFEGQFIACRFGEWSGEAPRQRGTWPGIAPTRWSSSTDRMRYCADVRAIQSRIACGDVYQVNLCRVLRAHMDMPGDISALDSLLVQHNPSPYGGYLRVDELQLACASPELFLRRDGGHVVSGPIKGTAALGSGMMEKDRAENVMITDLVRNDLSRVAVVGSVRVPHLLSEEAHPGLTHLVSYVHADVSRETPWSEILKATFPPGSVTGAPKHTALRAIAELEHAPRSLYCGAFGWVDGDSGDGCLAVTIRTFWREGEDLCFGTGAGITWGSDPDSEWEETELKAHHLLSVASMVLP